MLPKMTGGIFTTEFIKNITRHLLIPVDPADAQKSLSEKILMIEKWLQHGMSRFSKETLQSFLRYLIHYMSKNSTRIRLQSICDIQRYLTKLKLDNNGKLTDEDKRLIAFFNNFIQDLEHIKVIKLAYNTEIYDYLYDSYYDPLENERKKSHSGVVSGMDYQSESSEEAVYISPRKLGVSTLDIISGDANEKLSVIVHELGDIKKRWDNLLLEDQICEDDFDPDSKHELHHLSAYELYEPILRLIPDMFTKCYKCVQLAKQWLNLAPKVYTSLPFLNKSRHSSIKEIKKSDKPSMIEISEPSTLQLSALSTTKSLSPSSIQSFESPLVQSVTTLSRPQTSKPKSSSSSSSRNRIVIKKPRVAKYKPQNQNSCESTGTSELSLNLEPDDISEGVKKGVHLDHGTNLSHEKPYINDSSYNFPEYSATAMSGSFSSSTLTPQPSLVSSANMPNSDYTDMVVKLRGINRNIDDLELNLQKHKMDIEVFKRRGSRISGLENKYQSVQEQLENLQRKQESDQVKYSDVEEKMVSSISGTSKFFEYENDLKELKNCMHQREMEIKMLTFKIGVIEQDFNLETDMEPNFESIERDLEFEIQETESLLEQERNEKLELERDIALHYPKLSARDMSGYIERELTLESQRSSFSETNSDFENKLVQSGSDGSISDPFDNETRRSEIVRSKWN